MKNRPIKRRDVDFNLVAVFGFRQQQTGQKGAKRGREARATGDGGNPDHREQRDRHDEIAAAGLCREAENRLEHIAAGSEKGGDRKHGLQQSPRQRHRDMLLAAREELHPEQNRCHHEVLEQQHRERDAADRRGRAALFLQQLHHDRGRGHCEAKAEHDRAAAGQTQQRKGRADGEGRQHELQAADAGNIAAQRPQPRQRQFQPDQEQEKQDAQFGEGLDPGAILDGQIAKPGNIVGEPAEAVRADRDADTKKAEHGTDTRTMKQRNHKPGSGEKDEHVFQPRP